MGDTTTLQILIAARALIEPPGSWCRGARIRGAHGKIISRCGVLALSEVCGSSSFDDPASFLGARSTLRQVAIDRGFDNFPQFNDDPATTHADVLSAFTTAIEKAKSEWADLMSRKCNANATNSTTGTRSAQQSWCGPGQGKAQENQAKFAILAPIFCPAIRLSCSSPTLAVVSHSVTLNQSRGRGLMVEPVYLNIMTRKIKFTYRNWRGETGVRLAEPVGLWFGSTEWHPAPQWFFRATDTEKNAIRDFAVRDMTEVEYV